MLLELNDTLQYSGMQDDNSKMNPPNNKRQRLNTTTNLLDSDDVMLNSVAGGMHSPLLNNSNLNAMTQQGIFQGTSPERSFSVNASSTTAHNNAAMFGIQGSQNSGFDQALYFRGLAANRTNSERFPSHAGHQLSSLDMQAHVGTGNASLMDQHRLVILRRLAALRAGGIDPSAMNAMPTGNMFLDSSLSACTNQYMSPVGQPRVLPPPYGNNVATLGSCAGYPSTTTAGTDVAARASVGSIPMMSGLFGSGGQIPDFFPPRRGSGVRGDMSEQLYSYNHGRLPDPSLSYSVSNNARAGRIGSGLSGKGTIDSLRKMPKDDKPEPILHYCQRIHVPLATDEDQNWLSDFLCFVRSELVEVFRANHDDVKARNSSKKVSLGQIGIRCRFCAHLPTNARASRSSSYPSSVSRIYQSLTMMLRDHFSKCGAMPQHIQQRFLDLKGKTSQGATDSKHYWIHSSHKLGLVDSDSGIAIRDESESEAETGAVATSFGSSLANRESTGEPGVGNSGTGSAPVFLVHPSDIGTVSNYLYTLMSHAQLVHMEESERAGNRKNLPLGLPGIGCRHCCQSNRKGLCRLFPARRRRFGSKVNDLYEHLRRCTVCPPGLKEQLATLKAEEVLRVDRSPGEKDFFDRVWARMGHKTKDVAIESSASSKTDVVPDKERS